VDDARAEVFPQSPLRAFPFQLPSLGDQSRIVAELETLQAELEALKRLQSETDTEIKALLPSVLSKAFMVNCRRRSSNNKGRIDSYSLTSTGSPTSALE
jgi:hypothetical protein